MEKPVPVSQVHPTEDIRTKQQSREKKLVSFALIQLENRHVRYGGNDKQDQEHSCDRNVDLFVWRTANGPCLR
jgi:hypothetical protein